MILTMLTCVKFALFIYIFCFQSFLSFIFYSLFFLSLRVNLRINLTLECSPQNDHVISYDFFLIKVWLQRDEVISNGEMDFFAMNTLLVSFYRSYMI